MQNYFNEDDKKKFIDYLNSVADSAKFEMNTQQLCDYFKLLAHMQQVILPKINANILEVKKIVEAAPEPKTKGKK